jgi:hypothetical protein
MYEFETPLKFNLQIAELLLNLGLSFTVSWDGIISFPENMVFSLPAQQLDGELTENEEAFLKHVNTIQLEKYPYQPRKEPYTGPVCRGIKGISFKSYARDGLYVFGRLINI